MRTKAWWCGLVSSLFATSLSAATFTVSNANDTGPGSLRQAILDANASSPPNEILFTLPSPYTIAPLSPLPDITNKVALIAAHAEPTVRLDGASAGPFTYGIRIRQTAGCSVEGLRIYNFSAYGIYFDRADSNVILRCVIYSNTLDGVTVQDGSWNAIGSQAEWGKNTISGNAQSGISIYGNSISNVIQGCFIGTDSAGVGAWPNSGFGINLHGGVGTVVGGLNAVPGTLFPGNLISGNHLGGVHLNQNGHSHRIQGNFIGTDVTGLLALSNGYHGVQCYNSFSNTIGGNAPGFRNIISGNQRHGIYLQDSLCRYNVIVGNFIGTDHTGSNAVPNGWDGVHLYDAPMNQIGRPGMELNVLSGNTRDGIEIGGSAGVFGSTGTVVRGNFIGTDASGVVRLPNQGGVGIRVRSSHAIIGEGNVIAGNAREGIIVSDFGNHAIIRGNWIGPYATHLTGISNQWSGIHLSDVQQCVIGGTNAADRNILSGNGSHGIYMYGSNCVENTILGNYIGVDATGTNALGNGFYGVYIYQGQSNTIGEASTGGHNVISANAEDGMQLTQANANRIYNNFIGTDSSGILPLGNGGHGLNAWESSWNKIGGALSFEGNVLSANANSGILISGLASTRNEIQGNAIGCDATGMIPLGNAFGVEFTECVTNILGGGSSGDANLIAFNEQAGVRVRENGHGNVFLGNSIFNNGALGIELEGPGGVNTNDPLDADTGSNGLQNYPVLASATNTGTHILLSGNLHAEPNQEFWIEFFFNRNPDISGHGEGEYLLGRITGVQTDASGDASFTNINLELPDVPPDFITATAIQSNRWNTSEFSPALLLDSDGDGMGDGFEVEHFGHHTAGLPYDDKDGDGASNLDEFLADTDASSPSSAFRIAEIQCHATQTHVSLETSMHRQYYLHRTDTVANPGWSSVPSWFDGTGAQVTRTYTGVHTTHFFRAEARLPVIE